MISIFGQRIKTETTPDGGCVTIAWSVARDHESSDLKAEQASAAVADKVREAVIRWLEAK